MMKRELCLGAEEKFTLSDGIFRRLKTRFGVNVALYTGDVINDNTRNKRCYYSTMNLNNEKRLHLLVADKKRVFFLAFCFSSFVNAMGKEKPA